MGWGGKVVGSMGGSGMERARVLVVEDDSANARDLAELLMGRYEVGIATTAAGALSAAREHHPDAVVLDLGLPDRDGLELLTDLVGTRETEDAQVIIYSARDDEQSVVKALEAGAADYLTKPTSGRELCARIDRAVRQGRTERALKRLAQTDALTGLSNYGALEGRLAEEVSRARRYRHSLSIVVIDLDHLKQVNDKHGHEIGNRAILGLSKKLKNTLRETDFAARFGGDEFVVLLPYQGEQAALIFVERLRQSLTGILVEDLDGSPLDLKLSLSAGVSELSAEKNVVDARQLMDAADAALYEAKRRGRNCAVGFRSLPEGAPQRAHTH